MNKLLHLTGNLIGTAYNLMRECSLKGIMEAINVPSSDMVAYGMIKLLGKEKLELNLQLYGMRLISNGKRTR